MTLQLAILNQKSLLLQSHLPLVVRVSIIVVTDKTSTQKSLKSVGRPDYIEELNAGGSREGPASLRSCQVDAAMNISKVLPNYSSAPVSTHVMGAFGLSHIDQTESGAQPLVM